MILIGGNNCDDKNTNADWNILEINRSSMFSFLGGDVSAGIPTWTGVSGCTCSHLSGWRQRRTVACLHLRLRADVRMGSGASASEGSRPQPEPGPERALTPAGRRRFTLQVRYLGCILSASWEPVDTLKLKYSTFYSATLIYCYSYSYFQLLYFGKWCKVIVIITAVVVVVVPIYIIIIITNTNRLAKNRPRPKSCNNYQYTNK